MKKKETDCCKRTIEDNQLSYDDETLSFADQILKKRKIDVATSAYIDLRFLLPTSNICERLFSKAGQALCKRRKGTSPVGFEQQLFLHVNFEVWDISDVNAIVQ